MADNKDFKLMNFSNGSQVLVSLAPGTTVDVTIDQATPVSEHALPINASRFDELAQKVADNNLEFDTISGNITIMPKENITDNDLEATS